MGVVAIQDDPVVGQGVNVWCWNFVASVESYVVRPLKFTQIKIICVTDFYLHVSKIRKNGNSKSSLDKILLFNGTKNRNVRRDIFGALDNVYVARFVLGLYKGSKVNVLIECFMKFKRIKAGAYFISIP